MSYILDSLGKAEKSRQVSQSPDLKHVFEPEPTHSRADNSGRFWYSIGLFFAFSLGVLLSPKLQQLWNKTPLVIPTSEEDPIKNYAEKIKLDRSSKPTQSPVFTNTKPTLPAITVSPPPLSPVVSVPPKVEPVLTKALTTRPMKPDEINISVISYSEDVSKRFAMINGSIVKQGDVLADGYRIEQINSQTIEVSLGNQGFTLGLK